MKQTEIKTEHLIFLCLSQKHINKQKDRNPVLSYLFKFLFLRERERERENASGGWVETEGYRGSEAGSVLTAESPIWGLNLQITRS